MCPWAVPSEAVSSTGGLLNTHVRRAPARLLQSRRMAHQLSCYDRRTTRQIQGLSAWGLDDLRAQEVSNNALAHRHCVFLRAVAAIHTYGTWQLRLHSRDWSHVRHTMPCQFPHRMFHVSVVAMKRRVMTMRPYVSLWHLYVFARQTYKCHKSVTRIRSKRVVARQTYKCHKSATLIRSKRISATSL